jgi:hypothetical protein
MRMATRAALLGSTSRPDLGNLPLRSAQALSAVPRLDRAVRPMSRGAACPDEPPTEANQHQRVAQ